MAKKMDQVETKKECPSCGLGVALDSTICEFCGWDFEEEDEWILQIEKLERELMLEKQKFEPGTVNHMIESTLRNPFVERVETARAAGTTAQEQAAKPEPVKPFVPYEEEEPCVVSEPIAQAPEPSPPAGKVRRVRSVKAPPPEIVTMPAPVQTPPEQAPADDGVKKTRVVRRVKIRQ